MKSGRTSLVEVTDNPDINGNDEVMAKNMAETLHKHYPGQLWAVTCDGRSGVATVRNLSLSANWGYIIKLQNLKADHDGKLVMRAGGEILERFKVARERGIDLERVYELHQAPNGMPVFDHAGAKSPVPQINRDSWDAANGRKPDPAPVTVTVNHGPTH